MAAGKKKKAPKKSVAKKKIAQKAATKKKVTKKAKKKTIRARAVSKTKGASKKSSSKAISGSKNKKSTVKKTAAKKSAGRNSVAKKSKIKNRRKYIRFPADENTLAQIEPLASSGGPVVGLVINESKRGCRLLAVNGSFKVGDRKRFTIGALAPVVGVIKWVEENDGYVALGVKY